MTTSPTAHSDSMLLHQFAQMRDHSAFQLLADRHINWIYSTALRLTQNPALAVDVTQGVLLALAQKAPKLARHPSLPAWLFRATRYGAHTLLRSERRRKRHEGAIMPPSQSAPDLDWSDLSPKLDAAVARLSTQDQQAILLRFYQQLTHPAIAAALNITEEAARKRVDRALARLRTHLNVNSPQALATTLTTSLALSAPNHLSANLLANATPHALAASKGITSLFLLSTLKTAAAITLLTLIPLTLTAAVVVHESQNLQPPAPIAAADPPAPRHHPIHTTRALRCLRRHHPQRTKPTRPRHPSRLPRYHTPHLHPHHPRRAASLFPSPKHPDHPQTSLPPPPTASIKSISTADPTILSSKTSASPSNPPAKSPSPPSTPTTNPSPTQNPHRIPRP